MFVCFRVCFPAIVAVPPDFAGSCLLPLPTILAMSFLLGDTCATMMLLPKNTGCSAVFSLLVSLPVLVPTRRFSWFCSGFGLFFVCSFCAFSGSGFTSSSSESDCVVCSYCAASSNFLDLLFFPLLSMHFYLLQGFDVWLLSFWLVVGLTVVLGCFFCIHWRLR